MTGYSFNACFWEDVCQFFIHYLDNFVLYQTTMSNKGFCMTTIRELHHESMKTFHQARNFRDYGNIIEKGSVQELFEKAFQLERDAAMLLLDKPELEPTRSILFRGAASLALQASLTNEALQMAKYGMDGNPPPRILNGLTKIVNECQQKGVE